MKIKNKELLRTLKYALIAVSAGVIQFVVSFLLKLILDHTGLKGQSIYFIKEFLTTTFIADTVGLFLSVLWNCTFNRKYTFKAANNIPVAMCLVLLFYVPFYPFQIWYVDAIEKAINVEIWGYLVGLVTCMLINGVLEFLWQRFVVFRKSLDTNSAAKKEEQAAEQEQQAEAESEQAQSEDGERGEETTATENEVGATAEEESK